MKIGFFGKRGDDVTPDDRAQPTLKHPGEPAAPGGDGQEHRAERALPPPLPPSLLRELERVAGRGADGFGEHPPASVDDKLPAQSAEPLAYQGTLDRSVLDAIFACRELVEKVLAAETKEFQVLKILSETDLGVCSELTDDLRQRLSGHAVYQVLVKLDEAHRLALRCQKPAGRHD